MITLSKSQACEPLSVCLLSLCMGALEKGTVTATNITAYSAGCHSMVAVMSPQAHILNTQSPVYGVILRGHAWSFKEMGSDGQKQDTRGGSRRLQPSPGSSLSSYLLALRQRHTFPTMMDWNFFETISQSNPFLPWAVSVGIWSQ